MNYLSYAHIAHADLNNGLTLSGLVYGPMCSCVSVKDCKAFFQPDQ